MQKALTPGQYVTLRLDTIERQAKALTQAQKDALIRVRDHGSEARGAAGGISRMWNRLETAGLVAGPPYRVTEHGLKVLAAAPAPSPENGE